MQNYSQVFADTLARFESPYVPGDQGDAGKGQVTALAGYTIATTLNAAIGYIGKSPGQTQYYGISVDALKDVTDGTWADYLTDELQPDGRRLIKLAYSPTNTPGGVADWVQPTEAMTQHGGPLVLKSDSGDGGEGEPWPPSDDSARFDAIDAQLVALAEQQASDTAALSSQQAADTATVLAAIQHFEDRFNQIVEDVEESLQELLPWLIVLWRRDDAAKNRSRDDAADAAANLHAWLVARKGEPPTTEP